MDNVALTSIFSKKSGDDVLFFMSSNFVSMIEKSVRSLYSRWSMCSGSASIVDGVIKDPMSKLQEEGVG